MHLVLNEIVDQWHKSTKEQTGHDLAVLQGTTVVRTESNATQGPRQRRHQVRDHEDVVPVMVIGRSHISPATTGEGPEDTHTGNQLWEVRVRPSRQDIPQEDQGETRTGGNGNEHLEERPLGVPIANRRRHGGEPFIGIAVVLVLDNLVEMQGHAHYQGAEEGTVREERMAPGHPFSIDLDLQNSVSPLPILQSPQSPSAPASSFHSRLRRHPRP